MLPQSPPLDFYFMRPEHSRRPMDPAAQSSYTTKGICCLGAQKREVSAVSAATRALNCPSGIALYILFSKPISGTPPATNGTLGWGAKGGMIILKSFVRIHSSKVWMPALVRIVTSPVVVLAQSIRPGFGGSVMATAQRPPYTPWHFLPDAQLKLQPIRSRRRSE